MTELEFLRELEQVVQHAHHALSEPFACPSDATRVRVAQTYVGRAKKLLNSRIIEVAEAEQADLELEDELGCIAAEGHSNAY